MPELQVAQEPLHVDVGAASAEEHGRGDVVGVRHHLRVWEADVGVGPGLVEGEEGGGEGALDGVEEVGVGFGRDAEGVLLRAAVLPDDLEEVALFEERKDLVEVLGLIADAGLAWLDTEGFYSDVSHMRMRWMEAKVLAHQRSNLSKSEEQRSPSSSVPCRKTAAA